MRVLTRFNVGTNLTTKEKTVFLRSLALSVQTRVHVQMTNRNVSQVITNMFGVHLAVVLFRLHDLLLYDGTHTRSTHWNPEQVR